MATIHATTLVPSKLELLSAWLPSRPWYAGAPEPNLTRVGGFRLDDPDGEVGIEVVLVGDTAGTVYLTPMTYRGTPLEGADAALIGTSEHGVLGTRWIYDAAHDTVALTELLGLLAGRGQAQHQDVSDAVDPTVVVDPVLAADAAVSTPLQVVDEVGTTTVWLHPQGWRLQVLRLVDSVTGQQPALGTICKDVPDLGRVDLFRVVGAVAT